MYGGPRFRIVVVILLVLIVWQFFRLIRKSENDFIFAQSEVSKMDTTPNRSLKVFNIDVYYEALCPDSRHFFLHHLLPAQETFKDYLKINLIPYGKAKTLTNSAGKLDFKCQHGIVECYANKIHACSLNFMDNDLDRVKFTTCMITDNLDPDNALYRCGELDEIDVDPIRKCANEGQGSELLKEHGLKTDKIQPYFIPTIIIDGSKDNQASILKNFRAEICKLYDSSEKPANICS